MIEPRELAGADPRARAQVGKKLVVLIAVTAVAEKQVADYERAENTSPPSSRGRPHHRPQASLPPRVPSLRRCIIYQSNGHRSLHLPGTMQPLWPALAASLAVTVYTLLREGSARRA